MSYTENGLRNGTILNSGRRRYEVTRVLGAGGFGITYLVRSELENIYTYFAIKEHFIADKCERDGNTVVYSQPVKNAVETSLHDFISEAKRLNSNDVKHPNIVRINEVFEGNNTAYYVMEYIEGLNLRQSVARTLKGDPYSEEEMLSIMTPVLKAVKKMHSAHINHLDIKPDNIILSTDKVTGEIRPVIIDFGGSKHFDHEGNLTSTFNIVACSPGYSPMEQYTGLSKFTPQADVYALGATMYFMLTATDPMAAGDVRVEMIREALRPFASEKICRAISNAMMPIKSHRIKSIDELAEELGVDISSDSTDIQPPAAAPRGGKGYNTPAMDPVLTDTPLITSAEIEDAQKVTPLKSTIVQPRSQSENRNLTVAERKFPFNKRWLIIGVAALVIVILVILANLLLPKSDPMKEMNTDSIAEAVKTEADSPTVAESPTDAEEIPVSEPQTEQTVQIAEKEKPAAEKPTAAKQDTKQEQTTKPESKPAKKPANEFEALKQAADGGDKAAAGRLAQHYLSSDGGSAESIRQAVKYAKKANNEAGRKVIEEAKKLGYEE